MNIQISENKSNMINYIQNNIKFIENTNCLINFIKTNDINYSENINGLFINLILLDEIKLKIFYDIIYFTINKETKENKEKLIEIDNTENTINKAITTREVSPIVFQKIKLTNLQKNLLEYSK